ncbi:hypothetical protein CR513_12178, partial [Mucuna pruriens]
MAKGSVLNEEMRRKAQGSSSRSKAFVTKNRGRSQEKGREKSRSRSKSRNKNVEYHYYHKTGYIHKHCFLWRKENKGKNGKSKEKSHDDDDDNVITAIGDDLVILKDFELVNLVSNESIWIIDSGATLHDMLPRLKNAELEKYSHCMTGKQIIVSFKKHPPSRKLELLELVHSNVCGPLKDEYSYKLYDPDEKKLIKSCDVQFMEDKTIKDIDKVQKTTLEKDNSLFEIDPIWMPIHDLNTIENNVQNGEQHDYVGDQQLKDVFDVPPDDDIEEELEMSQDDNSGDSPKPPLVQLKKSNRQRQSSIRCPLDEYVSLTDGKEPMESEERQKWLDAVQDEIKSLNDNHTYDLVKFPKGKKVMENRWIYKVSGKEDYVYKPKKSLYGLKQAPNQWYKKFESVMCEQGYKKTTSDHYVFVRKFSDDDFIILLLYVDDMLVVGKSVSRTDRLKKQLSESFAMKDMGATK